MECSSQSGAGQGLLLEAIQVQDQISHSCSYPPDPRKLSGNAAQFPIFGTSYYLLSLGKMQIPVDCKLGPMAVGIKAVKPLINQRSRHLPK